MNLSAYNLKVEGVSTKSRILTTTTNSLTLDAIESLSFLSGEDGKTTLEHVGQFILQCGEASANDVLELRMFPLSLSSTAFTWFTSLAANSIFTWAQLEQKFYEYFYSGDTELRLSHLTAIKQKHNESTTEYIRAFRDTRNK
jgi:hypothetical protein